MGFEHGTIVSVEDLFFNVPARLKFLKSAQTEFFYCYNYFVDVALWHYDKSFVLKKNDRVSFDLKPVRDLKDRIVDIYKKDWRKNLKAFEVQNEVMKLSGVVSDPSLRFGSGENIKIYVNGRPIQDKIIRKALMDAYNRQITPGEFPFVLLMLEMDPKLVDVNVHPSKLQVKFADSKMVYQMVYDTVSEALGGNKIAQQYINYSQKGYVPSQATGAVLDQVVGDITSPSFGSPASTRDVSLDREGILADGPSAEKLFAFDQATNPSVQSVFHLDQFTESGQNAKVFFSPEVGEYQVIGQLWNSYVVLQSQDALYYIDQHALAERIAYEKMKQEQDINPEVLLQPLKFEINQVPDLEEKIWELNQLGFEISLLGENVIVIYAIPRVFVANPVDMQQLLNHVLYLEKISFDHMMDSVYASKACKTSIKS